MTEARSDAPTVPMNVVEPAPRNSATLIVAATLAFVGAAITVGALFPDYWDAPSFALIDDTATLAQAAVLAGALLLGGILLLARSSAPIGSALLVVAVAFGLQPRAADIVTLAESNGPRAGTGFSLITAGFVLGVFAAVLSAFVALRPRAWAMRGGARLLAVLAALLGFGAAVGYVMNPFSIRFDGVAFDLVGGSPFDTSDPSASRELWAAVLVVVLLAVVPPVAVAVGGRIGSGLALGLLFGIGGIAALRLGAIYGSTDVGGRGSSGGLEGAEGTWTFLAAGGAALIVTFFGIAAGGVRRPRASAMEPVTSTTAPSDEPVVIGGDPGAIVEPADAPSGDDRDTVESERTRVDPMPSARPPATTWNATAESDDDRPPE